MAALTTLGQRSIATAIALGALAVIAVVGWATYGPVEACSDPACAKQRFMVFVEIDSFRGVESAPTEALQDDEVVTLASILEGGGVRIQAEHDQAELPYAARSGALDRADLHRYAQVWRDRKAPGDADAGLYAMATPALVSDIGERLFGIMFDVEGREGFAVAPGETVRAFRDRNEESVELLQLRTFTHELLHALNRRHFDAVEMADGRLTLEAPTRCISASERGRWRLMEPPLMALSPTTIRFFQTASAPDILPGRANTPYEGLRTSATECDDVRRHRGHTPAFNRWQLARKRLQRFAWAPSANAQENNEDETGDPPASEDAEQSESGLPPPAVSLTLQAQPAAYPLGYPIAVRLIAVNDGPQPLPLRDRLSPAFGMVQFELRSIDENEWRAIKPLAWYEPASNVEAMLDEGESADETVPIYFSQDGWTFPRAGEYEVRARLLTSDDDAHALSNSVAVRIAAPEAEDDRAALAGLLDGEQQLEPRIGRLLMLNGRIGGEEDMFALEAISETFAHTALGSALRLVLVAHQLNPPIDPRTGERPTPELGEARELLTDACTDSGVAALKDQLLERFDQAAPAEATPGPERNASAWDGVTAERVAVSTYSNPSLQRFGASLHFCFDAESLSGTAHRQAREMASQLRRAQPERVIVVGHADHEAGCRYNDALALRRADAMRRLLLDAGLPEERVVSVSLGERRPLDFAATEDARMLNRRVEVLVEGELAAPTAPVAQIVPRCSLRRSVKTASAPPR